MFKNEISDKLQYFAQQGMDRETVAKAVRKKRGNRRSLTSSRLKHKKSQQLRLF